MHGFNAATEALGEAILTYAERRMRLQPVPLDGPRTFEELEAVAGNTITAEGLGGLAALKLFGDELAKACLSNDHPRSDRVVGRVPPRGIGETVARCAIVNPTTTEDDIIAMLDMMA